MHKRAFALNRLAVNLGFTIGPAVGGWLATIDYSWLFWIDASTCVLAGLALYAVMPPERHAAATAGDRESLAAERSPYRDGPFLAFLALILLTFSIFFQLLSTYPLYLNQEYGLAEWQIGLLLGLNTVLVVAIEMVLVHAIDGWNVVRTMGCGACLMCLGFGILPFSHGFAYAALGVVVWTVGEMLAMPQAMAFAASRSGQQNRSRYLGLYTTAVSLAFVVGPLVGSSLYRIDHNLLWYASNAVGLLVLAAFWTLGRATPSRSSRRRTRGSAARGRSPARGGRVADRPAAGRAPRSGETRRGAAN